MQRWITRAGLKRKVQNLLDDQGSATDTLLNEWINDIHRDIEDSEWDFDWLKRDFSFKLISGTSKYLLPDDFRKVLGRDSVRKDAINGTIIYPLYEQEYRTRYGDNPGKQGPITHYRLFGSPEFVDTQPAQESRLSVTSTSSSDTTPVLFVKGVSGNNVVWETVTLTGLTPAFTSSAYSRIDVISLDSDTVGTVAVKANNESVTVKTLSPSLRAVGRFYMTFHPVPDSAEDEKDVYIDYQAHIPDLVHNSDVSIVPDPNVIIEGLKWHVFTHQNQTVQANSQLLIYQAKKFDLVARDQMRSDIEESVNVEYTRTRVI